MFEKTVKIILILSLFMFTTGFLPFSALVGPGITIASSGNVYKATAQLLIDYEVKNKTGKNSLAYVKEEVEKQHQKNNFNEDLKNLVEKRVKITHKKILMQNEKKVLNKDFIQLVEKRIRIVRTKIDNVKINQ